MQQHPQPNHPEGDCQWDIIQHLDNALAVCSPDTETLQELNLAFANLHGYTIPQLRGKSWQNLVIPQQRKQWSKRLQWAQTKGTQIWETEHLSSQGIPLKVKVNLKAITDATGKLKYYLIAVEPAKISQTQTDQTFYHSVINIVAEGVVVQQADGQIIGCNISAQSILGLTHQQIIGRTSVDPSWRAIREDGSPFPGLEHPAMITLATGKPQHNVIMGIYKPEKNTPTWISINSQPLFREKETQPYAVVTTFTDITEQKLTEIRVKESQARLNTIITNIADGILIVDQQRQVRFANPAAAKLFNQSLEQLLNHKLEIDLIPNQIIEIPILQQENSPGIGEMNVTSSQWDGESVYIVSVRDITQRRAAEIALREREELMRATFEQSTVGIAYSNSNGRFFWVNQKFCEILGYTETELQQLTYIDITHPEDLALEQSQYAAQLLANEINAYSMDKRYIRKDGSPIWINLSTSLVRNQKGEIKYCVGMIRDISTRKKTEKNLRESEQRFRHIAENIREVFYIINRHHNQIIYISPACEQVWGISCEVLSQNINVWVESIHPEDSARIMAAVEQVLSTPEEFNQQYRIIRPDGSIRWIWDRSFPSYNQAGEFNYFVGIAEDITDRKQNEEKLRFQAQLLDNVRESIIATDLDAKITYWSKGSQELYGYSAQEVLGQLITFVVAPQEKLEEERRIAQVLEQGYWQGQYWQRRKDGSLFWADTVISLIKNEKGQPIGLIGIDRDLTGRKQAEQALLESEERFRAIFEQAAVGMSLSSSSAKLLRVNQKLCQFLGYSETELLGLSWQDVTYPDDTEPNLTYFHQLIAGEINTYSLEKRYRRKDGQLVWGNLNVASIYNSKGELQFCLAVVEDITERKQAKLEMKRAKEAAEAANQAKSQFLANMSHELRTPLNAILGFTQIMSRSSATPPEHRKYLEVVSRSGEHLLSLINDVLDLAKIEAGKTLLQEESFNFLALLDSLKKMFDIKAQAKDLILILALDDLVPKTIKADQKKIRSTLINILDNAIKFTNSGQVILRVSAIYNQEKNISEDDLVNLHFEIEDTGIGIAPEDLDTLFDAFVQTRTGQNALEGTGLGLTISRHFVRMMGGEITVNSTLGVGSIFQFDLTCRRVFKTNPRLAKTTPKIIGIASNQPKYRILVVEDQITNQELLVNLLKPIGFDVSTAENGAIALEIWRDWQPHLIWMDMRMPVMDGYEATKKIRASVNGDKTIIIALTASVLEQQRSTIIATGCNDFVGKPFDQEIIYEKLSQYLGVRYLYEDFNSNSQVHSYETYNTNLLSENELKYQILQMNTEWVAQLHQAAISARETKIFQLIKQISQNNELLALTLTHLVNKLAFEKIANLTNAIRDESKNGSI